MQIFIQPWMSIASSFVFRGFAVTIRLAIDIGGTFTDLVLDNEGNLHTEKLLTTHLNPTDAVFQGIKQLFSTTSVKASELELVIHGTTLATNAIIERKGAKTALLTTEGHRDVLEMAAENRFEQYDVNIERPEPLIPRYLRLPVRERIGAGGAILRPFEKSSLESAIKILEQEHVQSVAIGFLHAYTNPVHEEIARETLATRLPDLPILSIFRSMPGD